MNRVNERSGKGASHRDGGRRNVPDLDCHVRNLGFIQTAMGRQWKVSIMNVAYLCHQKIPLALKSRMNEQWSRVDSQTWPVWLSWLEHCPVNQKVVGSIPSQSTCLGCRFSSQSGHVQEATNPFSLTSKFLSLSLSIPSPLSKINKHVLG